MRILSRGALSIFLLLLLSFAGTAQAESGAKQVLQTTINEVLKELNDPALHTENGRDAVLARVEKTISRLFDFGELSARTVGTQWRSFSDDQKRRFTEAFTTLLRESYLEKFEGYNGEQVEYKGEVASSDGNRVEIQTSLLMKEKAVPVAYRMIKKQQWVVYDVNIEGVGMVQNYRKQFQDILAKGDAESLITIVIQKAQEAREHNKKQQLAK